MRSVSLLQATLVVGVFWAASFEANLLSQERSQRVFNPRVVLKNPLRAIVDAPMIPASQVTKKVVVDDELVLGVVVNGQPRAYPINMLTGPTREIINDQLGGQAIAATW